LADPETGIHRVFIGAGFTFLNEGGGSGGPGGVERYLEADIDLDPPLGSKFLDATPRMILKDTAEGDQGSIDFATSTVVP
jgi:hypothetical protein